MLDIDALADVIASRDSHLTLDMPAAVADALRRLLADRESQIAALAAEIAQLRQRAATAELALVNQTRRTADEYAPEWLETLRECGAL